MTSISTVSTRVSHFISDAIAYCASQCLRATVSALLFLVLLCVGPVRADLVSPYGGETAPSFAELMVLEDRVRVVLEIDRADFPFFVAPEDGSGTGLAERTGRTMRIEANGTPLVPVTRVVDLRQRKTRQTSATPLVAPRPRSAEVIYAELEYPFQGRPEAITFIPPLDAQGRPLASIGVLAEHMGVAVTDYRYLSQRETMRLDWEDPWFTRFDNPNLTRHHASPLMSFIAVEPREVRHELILRLSDLERWVDLPLANTEEIGEAEMLIVADAAARFLEDRNPLYVDGSEAEAADIRVSRISVGVEGLRVLAPDALTPRRTTLLGVILSYPQPMLVGQVKMEWGLFPDGVTAVPVTLSDPTGGVPAQVRPDDRSVVWTNHLKTWQPLATEPVVLQAGTVLRAPLLSVGLVLLAILLAGLAVKGAHKARRLVAAGIAIALAGAASPVTSELRLPLSRGLEVETAANVLSGLVENAGVAALETQKDAFFGALAPFVAEANQAAVGGEILRGLTVTLPSGARGRVEEINELVVEEVGAPADDGSQTVLAHWTATLSGGHWGHQHRRNITYRALVEITPQDSTWMLSGLTVLRAD